MQQPDQARVDDLANSALMRSHLLSDADRAALSHAIGTARTVPVGTELLRERETADGIYILAAGWACRHKTLRDGGRQMPALLVPGDICNLDSLLLGAADHGIRTLTDTVLHILPRDRALELCLAHPGIALAVTRIALVETLILSRWAVCLGRQSARSRLAHLLCELDVRLAAPAPAGASRFDLPLTQEQLADVLGLTSVHVNRTIQQLRAEGLIVSQGRTIAIPDILRLRGVGEFDPAYLHAGSETAQAATHAASQPRSQVQLGL